MLIGTVRFPEPIEKSLGELDEKIRRKFMRIACNRAASGTKKAVVDAAPSLTGTTKKSIRIKVKGYKSGTVWSVVVGPKSGFKKTKGKRTRGKFKGEGIVRYPARYNSVLNFGTKRTKKTDYFKRAAESSDTGFFDKVVETLTGLIDGSLKY